MDNFAGIAPTPASHITQGTTLAQNITMDEWRQKYWFNSLQMVTVVNPKPDLWPFMVEGRHFEIGGGATERFPGVIANVYLDQMSKILAQDDERLGFMADPNLSKIYYDKLIVDVEDLIQQASVVPAYLRMPQAAPQQQIERAPWDSTVGERASDLAATLPPPPAPTFPEPKAPEPEQPIVPQERSFEQDGSTYKLVVGKDGRKLHYQNGKLITAADFNKAASLL